MMRFFLWVLLAGLFGTTISTAQPTEDVCSTPSRCLNLISDTRYVTIESVRAVSELPVYATPLLQLTVTIKQADELPESFFIETGDYMLTSLAGTERKPHCDLLIVGSDENGRFVRYYPVSKNQRIVTIPLYAFCQTMNLPGTGGHATLRFPSAQTQLAPSQIISVPSPNRALFTDLRTILQIANDEKCRLANGDPVTIKSLIVQFAVFILTTTEHQRETIWQDFLTRANNALYREERAAIYCLLKDIGENGIAEPFPTPTITPTPTVTPTPTAKLDTPPTSTPTPLPTATTIPVLDTQINIPNSPVNGWSLEHALTLTFMLGMGVFTILIGGMLAQSSRWPRRRIIAALGLAGIALTALFLLNTLNSRAQAAEDARPQLLLLVLLDDSRTMDNVMNSAATSGALAGKRTHSDPSNMRYKALEALFTELHADKSRSHQVAVLSYATTNANIWLSGSEGNRFISLGAGVDDAALTTLIENLNSKREYFQGAGDTADAFNNYARSVLERRLEADDARRFKPLVLHITDDVPMTNFSTTSPWVNKNAWLESSTRINFEENLERLAGESLHNSTCSSNTEGLQVITFSFGAGNWVRADGTLQTQVEIEADKSIFGGDRADEEYYPALARRIGSVWPDGQPMVYRIDPAFDSTRNISEALSLAVSDMLARLNCRWQLQSGDIELLDAPLNSKIYSVRVSDLYDSLWAHIDVPSGVNPVITKNGVPLTVSYKAIPWDNNITRYQWQMKSEDVPPGSWGGEWRISFQGNRLDEIDIRFYADLNFDGIAAQIESRSDGLTPGRETPIQIRITKNGFPIQDSAIIRNISLQLNNSDTPIPLSPLTDGLYEGNIPAATVERAGSFTANIVIRLNTQPGTILPQTLDFILAESLIFGAGLVFNAEAPPSGEEWDKYCYGTGEQSPQIGVRLSFSTDADQITAESIGSYARVEVYYDDIPNASQEPVVTPVAILSFDRRSNRHFFGEIPCSVIIPGAEQRIVARAIFPGAESIQDYFIVFSLSTPTPTLPPTTTPTATPTSQSTATVTPTATVTSTPSPKPANIVEDAVTTFTSPLVILAIGIIGCVTIAGVFYTGVQSVFYLLMPLREISIYRNDEDMPLRLGYRHGDVTATGPNQTEIRIFSVRTQRMPPETIIVPLVETLRINGSSVSLGQQYNFDQRSIKIQHDNVTYTVVNRRGNAS